MKTFDKLLKTIAFAGALGSLTLAIPNLIAQTGPALSEDLPTEEMPYEKAFVDFDFFEKTTQEAKEHRKERLVDFATFFQYSLDSNTIILDARSARQFAKMHVKGAININFADFTQDYLEEMIPSKDTRILIYCNNNFSQEPIFVEPFPSKIALPEPEPKLDDSRGSIDEKPNTTLALNIPTFINLYGYGYKNVYELHELIYSDNLLLQLEGTDVK